MAVTGDTLGTYLTAARETPLPRSQIIEGLERQIRSKHDWIERFSTGRNKRPDNEITTALFNLQVLVQARDLIVEVGKHDPT